MRGNRHSANVQWRIVGIGALQRQETIGRHFARLNSIVPLLQLSGRPIRRLLCLLIGLYQTRFVVVVVALQQLRTDRDELA